MSKNEKRKVTAKKRRPMSEIAKDIKANRQKRPSREQVNKLFEIFAEEIKGEGEMNWCEYHCIRKPNGDHHDSCPASTTYPDGGESIEMPKLSDLLLKAAEFNPDRSTKDAKSQWTNNISPPDYDEYFSEGADCENARLLKLILAIAPVLDAAEQSSLQIKFVNNRPTAKWIDMQVRVTEAIDKALKDLK